MTASSPDRAAAIVAAVNRPSRAGRNLPAAIAVGVGMGAVILGSLLFERHLFVAVLALSTAVGTWELAGALRRGASIAVPLPILLVGGQAMIWLSWPFGLRGLAVSFAGTALAMLVWRLRAGAAHYVRDITAAVFTATYVPLFCSFATLLVVAPDGKGRALTFLLCVVASDVGGYAAGVLAGKHPMAPTISPKKSWEGFAGSQIAGMAVGGLCVALLLRDDLVGGRAARVAARGQRHPGRPGGIDDQARSGHQGHGLAAARPRWADGPARLAAADRGRGLGRAQPRRAGLSRSPSDAPGASGERAAPDPLIPSPNIWNWPEIYEQENAAQDPDGVLWAALREAAPWAGADVLDVGCGDGFHLPVFAAEAASVTGLEPYPPLVERARRRVGDRARVLAGGADAIPLPDRSVDLVHARIAYFFGPGCRPGLAEAERVLRPGGAIAIIDLDATVPPYGAWMRSDIPHYDPQRVERFFAEQGFTHAPGAHASGGSRTGRPSRPCCASSSPRGWPTARGRPAGPTLPVGYRLHVRRKGIVAADRGAADDSGAA